MYIREYLIKSLDNMYNKRRFLMGVVFDYVFLLFLHFIAMGPSINYVRT